MPDLTRGTVRPPTQVTVAGAAVLIVAAKTRASLMLRNTSKTVTIYLGVDSTVTTTNGFPLLPGEPFNDDFGVQDWYGITVGDAAIVAVMELVP